VVKVGHLNLLHKLQVIDKEAWVRALPKDAKPVLFHVGIELLHGVNFINRPKALVAHKPMGPLLGKVAELEEGDLHKKAIFLKASTYQWEEDGII